MRYYSQYEVEQILEYLYERQAAWVRPELRKRCRPLLETAEMIADLKEAGFEAIALELGKRRDGDRDGCKGECLQGKEG